MIDLLNVQPHQISTDIRGYKILMYALPGLGKTSEAVKPEGSLLFAVEKGYLAIAGVNAVDITSWADILTAVAQLKKPEVKERFKHVVIDTIDELVYIAEKHICQTHGVTQLNEIAWGQGHKILESMFRGLFRDIVNQNYGLTLIAHPTQKKRNPDDETTAYMTLAIGGKAAKIINGLVDITAYLEQEFDDKGNVMTYAYFRTTPRFEAKSRFKYIVPRIVWSYENLAIAIQDAIKKEAESKNLSTSNTFDNSIAEYEITESEFQELVEKTLSIAKGLVDNGKQQIVQEQMELILGKRLTETTIHDAKEVTALLATLEAL